MLIEIVKLELEIMGNHLTCTEDNRNLFYIPAENSFIIIFATKLITIQFENSK